MADPNDINKELEEKKWRTLDKVRRIDPSRPANLGTLKSGYDILLETFHDIDYIRKGLKPVQGVLSSTDERNIHKQLRDALPAGTALLLKYHYKRDHSGQSMQTSLIRNVSVFPEGHQEWDANGNTISFSVDPAKQEGDYFVPVTSSKPSLGVDDRTLTPEQRRERARESTQSALEIEACLKGFTQMCKAPKTQQMAEVIKQGQFLYDHALGKIPLSKIPAVLKSASPKDIERANRKLQHGDEEEEEAVDVGHPVDDSGQPKQGADSEPEPLPPEEPSEEPTKPSEEPFVGDVPGSGSVGGAIGGAVGGGVGIASIEADDGLLPEEREYVQVHTRLQAQYNTLHQLCLAALQTARDGRQPDDYRRLVPSGRPTGTYRVDADLLRGAAPRSEDDSDLQNLPRFSKAFSAILSASEELRDFYGPSVEDGYDDDRIANTMRLFGFFKTPQQPLATGDILRLADPMATDGFNWAVVIAAQGTNITEALICGVRGKPYRLRRSNFGQVTSAWCPALCRLLEENSPAGRFWGPNMTHISALPGGSFAYGSDLISFVFKERYAITSHEELMARLGGELRVLSAQNPAVPGAIVTADDGTFGVVARERQVFGFTGESSGQVRWIPWKLFRARYVWYPHLNT